MFFLVRLENSNRQSKHENRSGWHFDGKKKKKNSKERFSLTKSILGTRPVINTRYIGLTNVREGLVHSFEVFSILFITLKLYILFWDLWNAFVPNAVYPMPSGPR